jgi:hypothetical protein
MNQSVEEQVRRSPKNLAYQIQLDHWKHGVIWEAMYLVDQASDQTETVRYRQHFRKRLEEFARMMKDQDLL